MGRAGCSALLLGLAAFAVYAASFRTIQTIDTNTNVLLAYSLVRDRDVALDEYDADRGRLSYWSFVVDGQQVVPFPPGAALFATPFAALGLAVGIAPPTTASVTVVGRLAAAAAAAASVAFVFLAAARLAGRRRAAAVAALYAFGTVTWPISAGALWQHGPAQLALAIGLHELLRARHAAAGIAFGAATLARLPDAAYLLAAAAQLARARASIARAPAALARFASAAAIPVAILAAYLIVAVGSPFDTRYAAYNLATRPSPPDVAAAIVGMFVSPDRGLLVYSPFLALAIAGLGAAARRGDALGSLVRWQGAAALVLVVLFSLTVDWHGGYGYGNRYLADVLPLLALGLAVWLRRHRSRGSVVALGLTGAIGVVMASLGALFYDWQSWSWEALPSAQSMPWRLDPPQWWYAAARAPALADALSLASLAALLVGLTVFARVGLARGPAGRRPARRRPPDEALPADARQD